MRRLTKITPLILTGLLLASLSVACKKNYISEDEPVNNPQATPVEVEKQPENENKEATETDPTTGQKIRSITLDVTAYDRFVYFSFENGKLSISDEQSELFDGWDIAFHRTDIRTNSGESTKRGVQGGAYETDQVLLSQPVAVPSDDKFEVDERFVLAVYHTDEVGVQQDYRSANPVLTTRSRPRVDENNNFVRGDNNFIIYDIIRRGAIIMDRSRMPPSIEFSNKVYIVRTAKGQYAKIKITGYKRKPGTPMGDPGRLLTMDYVYPIR